MHFMNRFIVLVACLVLLPLSASAAGISLKGETLMSDSGKIESAEVGKVDNSALWFAALGAEDAEKAGEKPGLYIFDASGKQLHRLEAEYPEVIYGASLSPGGGVIAVISEGAGNSVLDFRDLASGKELGKTEECYVVAGGPGFLWVDDNTVVLSTGSLEEHDWYEIRKCEYDPCMAVSVEKFDIGKGTLETLFEGSGTCDYVLMGLTKGVVQVEKRCKAKAEDWKEAWPDEVKADLVTYDIAK